MTLLLLLLLLGQHGKPAGTISHTATLNWQNSSCTTAKPCSIAVYRATCSSSSSCPPYPNSGYAPPPTASLGVQVTATATNTSWTVTDTDPNLGDGTTYAYVATNSFTSNPSQPGPPSAVWSGTTSAAPNVPPAPVVGNGNQIQ